MVWAVETGACGMTHVESASAYDHLLAAKSGCDCSVWEVMACLVLHLLYVISREHSRRRMHALSASARAVQHVIVFNNAVLRIVVAGLAVFRAPPAQTAHKK